MKNTLTLILFAAMVLFITGCGNPKVAGKVVFPDGAPLTTGIVVFESDQNTYRGTIRNNGTFSMGVLADGEGIPPGDYRVAIMAFSQEDAAVGQDDSEVMLRPLTAPKFADARTSGITYTVSGSARNIEFVVERPAD